MPYGLKQNRVFHDKIKFYILKTEFTSRSALMIFKMWNVKLQFKISQVAHASLADLIKHSTLDPVMVSVVSSIPSRGNFLLNFLNLLMKIQD